MKDLLSKMDIVIVCHTEFGNAQGKEVNFHKGKVEGIVQGTKNLFNVAGKYGAKISFAVMPESAKHFPKELVKNKNCEVGLHLHPGWQYFYKPFGWYVGDSVLRKNLKKIKKTSTFFKDYSYKEQYEMIKFSRNYIKKTLKITPKFFVAGRWSENKDTVKVLSDLGFTHDCSILAGMKTNYFDYSSLPRICMPYYSDKILIVPISQFWPRGGVTVEAIPRYGLAWLKACFIEYYKQQAPLFHIFVHSPAMASKYYIRAFDKLLSFISKHNVNFKLVSEIKPFKPYKEKRFKTDVWLYFTAIPEFIARRLRLK